MQRRRVTAQLRGSLLLSSAVAVRSRRAVLASAAADHLIAIACFAALAVFWSWPLARHLDTDLAGSHIGDNAAFLWNFWWMRIALASKVSFFHTPYLFAPFGTDLTLDTHTALPAFVGATILAQTSALVALNVAILAGLALNGYCAYLLARQVTSRRGAAFVAGIIFGGSPYITAHLNGHFNLTTAWTIPLFAMPALTAIEDRRLGAAVAAGFVLAITAYIEEYYVVYEVALALLLVVLASTTWLIDWRARATSRWAWVVLTVLAAIDVAAIVSIATGGPYTIHAGPFRISMDTTFNARQLLGIIGFGALWMAARPRIRVCRRISGPATTLYAVLGTMAVTFLLVASPLVLQGIRLLVQGEYVSPHYPWRSAPAGIDIASLILGNPFHGIWGSTVRSMYSRFGIDVIESGAWLGIMPAALAAIALIRQRDNAAVRIWTVSGVLFFVWALGSHLRAFGSNTGVILPETLFRFVPIVSNARMPGRAIVMVYLSIAVLSAVAIAEWHTGSRYRQMLVLGLGLAVCLDYMSAPFGTVPVKCPPTFWTLGAETAPAGAVAVLPVGLADGFGDLTPFNRLTLACQPVYRRPLVGGFVSRLSPGLVARYRSDPLLAAWLRLSGAGPDVVPSAQELPDRQLATRQLQTDNIGFLMLDRHTSSDDLRAYVGTLPVRQISADDAYTLFRVDTTGADSPR